MKKLYFFLSIALFCMQYGTAQKVIVVQHNGTPDFYTTLNEAISGASNGDTIYLPGGQTEIGFDLIIDKELHIIGAGYRSDSSAQQTELFWMAVLVW